MDSADEQNARNYDAHAREWEAASATNVGHVYLEKPAMMAELDDLSGRNVLCIGVGSGEELGEILSKNPAHVVGIDTSTELLKLAEAKFPSVELHQMDMEDLAFPTGSFDFIYSSLALHYTKDWDQLLDTINRAMKPGATLLFSTPNPDYWAKKPATGHSVTNERGVVLSEHTAVLPGGVEITYYNHPNVDSIRDAVEHAGFKIEKSFTPIVIDMTDSVPEDVQKSYEGLRTKNAETPLFLVVKAKKQG